MNWMQTVKQLSIMLLGCLPLLARAAPDSSPYRFERLHVDSPDGQRHYRLDLAIPRRAAPAAGYPVVYLLDGNNAMAELGEDWLKELEAGNPPLLVMIGYDIADRYDMDQRTRDYTGAGSADFLTLIESSIKPLVQSRQPIDRTQQMLWGHSFGGLFVLYALFENPGAFQTWVAASPSLWFQPETFAKGSSFQGFQNTPARRVLIMRGSKEGKPPIAQFDGGSLERRKAMAAVPADANLQLTQHLQSLPGMVASYREFAGLNHSEMFTAALHPALRLAAGLKEAP